MCCQIYQLLRLFTYHLFCLISGQLFSFLLFRFRSLIFLIFGHYQLKFFNELLYAEQLRTTSRVCRTTSSKYSIACSNIDKVQTLRCWRTMHVDKAQTLLKNQTCSFTWNSRYDGQAASKSSSSWAFFCYSIACPTRTSLEPNLLCTVPQIRIYRVDVEHKNWKSWNPHLFCW